MNVSEAIALVAAITALLGALATVLVQMHSLTLRVDGRLSELLELTRRSSHAEGVRETLEASATPQGSPTDALPLQAPASELGVQPRARG